MIREMFADVMNQSIAAGYLIVAVIAARLLLKKAPKNVCCILWLLVGLRLVMPFSFVSVFSLIPSGTEVSGNIAYWTESNRTDADGHQTAIDSASLSNTGYIDEESIFASGIDNKSADSVNRPYVYFTIASVIWILGVCVMLLYLAVSWLRVVGRVRFAVPVEQNGVKYYQCETIDAPFLFGFFKVRIYVPSGLGRAELGYVLKHETVHRQRKDYLIKPIAYLLLALHWFNPLVWAAYLLLCRDIELACDERVIRELGGAYKKEYASALLTCSVNHKSIAVCPVAFGETSVKGRVKNVLRYKKPTFWGVAGTVAVVVVVAVCFMTEKVEADASVAQKSSGTQFVMTNPANPSSDDQELARTNGADQEYTFVTQWAEAFCSRDGNAILEMTDSSAIDEMMDTLNFEQGVDDNNEPYALFGWSSPWPWGSEGEEAKNYRIVSASDKNAVILYYAWVSDPHVTVWCEELSYTIENGKFQVTKQDIRFLEGICVADEFYKAYPDGIIDGTPMDYYAYNGAGEALNDNFKDPSMASSAYVGLDAPNTAAIALLNLLKNENKITTDVEYVNEAQTEAVVTFTFLENASTAKVRMIKPYGEDSIWLPQTY